MQEELGKPVLQRWWQLLREHAERADTPALRELATAARTWHGHASPGSVSRRLVRAWRLAVHARIADGLVAPARLALGETFTMPALPQLEGVAWPLVTQQPLNLLPPRFDSWDALFEDAAKEVRDSLASQGPLPARNWGEQNTAHICHPLAGALPGFAKRVLCMPFEPLRGDTHMPRVQSPDMGASERMVVSPGHEDDGIIHMPGGQSGHPLSPFWGAGHGDWVHGRATPFLPGTAEHALRIVPASGR
jgi:penicillin amidase